MKLVSSGVIENISTRSDNTLKIVIGLQEVDSTQAAGLFELRNKYVKVLLSDTGITDLEAATVDSVSLKASKKRSPSTRLRAVLFRVHEVSGLNSDFENFYTSEMERIIEHYKQKLNQDEAA